MCEERKPMLVAYKTRNGVEQYKPSIELLKILDENLEGFCLACGETEGWIEPDAVRATCSTCGAAKVYGASELMLMGLYF